MSALATLALSTQREILNLRAAGVSCDAIAAALNKRGVRGTAGGRWYGSTIHRVLRSVSQARQCGEAAT